jgi:predicted nicotinamide N-methyase
MREERIVIAERTLVIWRPEDPESLIDETRFDEDEFLPYWADLWPSGIALAQHVASVGLRGKSVLEVGCGLALPSFAAALAGANVVASDWAPEAIELVATNAAINGIELRAVVRDWAASPEPGAEVFDLVLAADVLYEARSAGPLIVLLAAAVAPEGEALIADPGRRHAPAFFAEAEAAGWIVEHLPIAALPAGGIARLRRSAG